MLTFIVEQNQIDNPYTILELQQFSINVGARVIIRDSAVIENGQLTSFEMFN